MIKPSAHVKLPAGAEPAVGNKEAIEQAFAAWAAGTGDPFALLADDATWTIAGRSAASRTYSGREDFLSELIGPFNARLREPLRPEVRSVVAEGDAVVILFDASGVARDGLPYRNSYSWHLRLKDGRIIEAVAFFDAIEFNEFWKRVAPASDAGRPA